MILDASPRALGRRRAPTAEAPIPFDPALSSRRRRPRAARRPGREVAGTEPIGLHGGAKLDLPAHPLLDGSFAVASAGFLRELVAPLGEVILGATVVALDTGPGYYCRSVDPGSRGEGQPTWQGHRDRCLRDPARRSAAHCGRT